MYLGVKAKFSSYPLLTNLLLNTGDATLVEHTRNDSYWGDGGDGTGMNRLGKILMQVREELRNELKQQQQLPKEDKEGGEGEREQ